MSLYDGFSDFYSTLLTGGSTSDALKAINAQFPCHVEFAEHVFARGFKASMEKSLEQGRLIGMAVDDYRGAFMRMRRKFFWLDKHPDANGRFGLSFDSMVAGTW